MERLKNMGLKKSFLLLSLSCLAVAFLLLGAVIFLCRGIENYYPLGGVEILSDGSIVPLPSPTTSQQRILAILNIVQTLSCILFPVGGLIVSVFLFYYLKLKQPISCLQNSIMRIQNNDLDFSLPILSNDEMGQLCAAFEEMRSELLKSNRLLWQQAEERKRLNAAFSHDLRNPITVLKGSVKLLRQGIQDEQTIDRLESYTLRIEQYVEAMSSVQKLEQLSVKPKEIRLSVLQSELQETARLLALSKKVSVLVPSNGTVCIRRLHIIKKGRSKMAKKKTQIPKYGTITLKGIQYYRTRITDADGKELSLYAATCEELYEKQLEARKQVEEIIFHRQHPTVAEYGEKWLLMQSAKVSASTLRGYTRDMTNYIIKPLGEMYMEEVTADDIRLALVPLSKKSEGLYNKVNMLLKCIFYAAERNQILEHNPCAGISGKGGKPTKKKEALTDQQVAVLLDTVKGLPPYLFIMLGLYSGLRREEILALQWDCVFLDEDTPYLSVRRAWRTEHNRPVISTVLKTPAAKRDIPIPKCLVDCLRETKENSISDYVIADSKGEPLAASQFQRVWQYVVVRSTKPRNYYKYVNGESIKYTVTPTLGMTQKNQPKIKYTLDFDVTPHQLRHTYITNLLYAGVDPKTVQYLAGHENSKTTMDIYAKVKYNKPEELFDVVNQAFIQDK